MGHEIDRRRIGTALSALLTVVLFLLLVAPAQAAPAHPRKESLDVTGLNHACGAAVDSKGDFYAASAGESKIKVYDASHKLLTEISDANLPCGLAVTTGGALYVTERATGEVVRFKPNAYPFAGTPTYGSREVIDSSAKAKGIAVDPKDNRLYVAEGDRVAVYKSDGTFEANLGEGKLTEATGVAPYTYSNGAVTDRYLWIADARGIAEDRLYLFAALEPGALALRRELSGSTTPDKSFGFGAAGAYLAADPGNRSGDKCVAVSEQACSAGHLFLYDAAHKALDEFDASGEYLGRTANASFADAEPTAVAIDRSGGTNDGTLYVTAGAGAGAKALAFGPLKQPKRETLGEPLSHILSQARSVAIDSQGDLYALAEGFVHVYGPNGIQIAEFEDPFSPKAIAVDSACNVYALDSEAEVNEKEEAVAGVTYYTPSTGKCPPKASTTYTRHEPLIVTAAEFPKGGNVLRAIAVNPGPGKGKDQLFVASNSFTRRYDSAANGSTGLDKEFGKCVSGITHQSIAVNGASGTVYISVNANGIFAVNEAGTECLARFDAKGSPSGKSGANPFPAVDQSNGHVIAYDGTSGSVHEYDAAGSFLAEFGSFTEGQAISYGLAVDSACAIHEPPLDETTTPTCKEFDPANGNLYLAFDDPGAAHPPYDVTAFGPLRYPEVAKRKLTVAKTGTGSGKVTSSPAGIDCGTTCSAEFLETEVVTLKAGAGENSKFDGWSGCEAQPSAGECEVTMSEAKTVKAEFNEEDGVPTYLLTVKKTGVGKGTVTSSPEGISCGSECSEEMHEFGEKLNVILKASAAAASEFVDWSGCDAEPSATECEVTMGEAREVKVEFDVEHPLLNVAREGTGTGTLTSSPPGIDCGSTCSAKFDLDEDVTLVATIELGSIFAGWSGCDAEPSATECEVTMGEAREVTASFEALPRALAKPAQPVLYDEVTLRGEVDTAELPTEYQFEYLSEEEYEENGKSFEGARQTPVEELVPGTGFVGVEAPAIDLEEGTAYRFRVLAQNSVGMAEDEGTFETLQRSVPPSCPNAAYRVGLSANLPDCRAYELVTPGQTNGLIPFVVNFATSPSGGFSKPVTVERGKGAGERLSYFTAGTLPGFEGNGVLDGYRAERGEGDHPAGGWRSALFSPSYEEAAPGLFSSPFQLGVAPDQLYSNWEIQPEPETFPGTLAPGVYLQTPSGFEALGRGSLGEDLEALSRYVSAGGTHAIFTSQEHLEEEAAPQGTQAVYDRAAGEASAEVVSVTPDGSAFGDGEGAAYAGATEDGAAVAFKVGGALYLHRQGETTDIAEAPNTFAGISEDGTRVFYAATTTGNSPAALYACDIEAGPCAGTGAQSPEEIAANGIFALVSSDGSYAFFSSTEALTGGEENDNGEEAEVGAHNLYDWDGSGAHFVGMLAASDFKQNAFADIGEMNLAAWTKAISFDFSETQGRSRAPVRSTPEGGVFVFQSHAQLTAFDNEGTGEIYRYEPVAEVGGRLVCVSCDPSGAPPSADALLEDTRNANGGPLNQLTTIANLTDGGEAVFFQSFDRLVPEDANEAEDVYEWRALGRGGCTRPSGCLALISSGQGETPSFLYAMSADGHDVFIHTKEKLVGADVAGSPSIYDARVGGGIPELATAAPCQGDACQGQGSEPPTLPNPATGGSGETTQAQKAGRCGKGRHRVKGRCVRVKHHKRHRRAHANRGGNR